MTLGQYLAMLQAGGVYEPTPPRPQAQTNIDWNTVASGLPEPEPLISQGFTGRPVEVVASRIQPTFTQPEVSDPAFQELYGPVPSAALPMEPEPQISRGYMGRPIEVSATRLPPLPIRGYMPPMEESAEIVSRPPQGMTDVRAFQTPSTLRYAAPGEDIAMLGSEQEPPVEPAPAEPTPEPAKEEPKPWQIGQPFQVTLPNNKTYTVKNYNARPDEQGVTSIASPTVTLVDDKGAELTYRRSVAPQIFEAANQTLQKQLEEAKKTATQGEFNSFVVVNGQRARATMQPDEYGILRLFYQTDDMPAPAEYTNVNELQEGQNFFSPPDQPSMLQDVQESRKKFVAPLIQNVLSVVGGFQNQPSPLEIASSLRPVWGAEPTEEERAAGQIFPQLTYNYVDRATGTEMTLDEAVQQGFVPEAAAGAVMAQVSNTMSTLEDLARSRAAFQELKPLELSEAEVNRIKTQRTQAQQELANANAMPQGSAAEIKARNAQIKNWNDVIKKLDGQLQAALSSGRQVSGQGGTTITAGAPSQYAFTLNPMTLEGALEIYSTGADPAKAGMPWTRDEFAQQIINEAIPNMPQRAIQAGTGFAKSVAALTPRFLRIEADAADRMGADAPNVLDMPIRFEFKDWTDGKGGIDSETTATLREAMGDFEQATKIYQRVMANPETTAEQRKIARQQMQQTAQVLAGTYYIQYPGDSTESQYLPESRDLAGLQDLRETLTPTPETTARIPGQRVAVPLGREIKAPEMTITRPTAGPQIKPVATSTFYPIFYRGGDTNNRQNYIKADLGFNIMESTRLNNDTYSTLVTNLSPAKSQSYIENMIARAGADDAGYFPPYKAATDGIVKSFNQEIIKDNPESKGMRASMAKWMHRLMKNLGLDIVQDEVGFSDDLEAIYTAVKQNPSMNVDSLVNALVAKHTANLTRQFNASPIGRNIANVGGEFYEGSTPAAIAQGKGMIRDAARLYAEAARGKTFTMGSYNNQLQVTWMPEFTSNPMQQSIVTSPLINKNPNVSPPATYAQAQSSAVSETDPSGVSKPLEPGMPTLLNKLADMKQAVDDLTAFMSRLPQWAQFKRVAENRHIPDMAGRNTLRDPNDTNTVFDRDSEEAMKRYFANAMGLYAMFPRRRIRTMIP